MTVLKVQQLGKAFCKYRSELRRVSSWFGINAGTVEKQWVLRDISFSVEGGESLAIIGQNGAGKSTLLKLIAGIQKPSEGSTVVHGQIAAILELGLGFNADFSGRQNVIQGLGLWGFSREEIESVLPDVEDFADIGEYFDQPVRMYSSGMQVRLAFAVATVNRPDLLIVDEALAVGDTAFQRKCFRRIENLRASGTSLLFVSHDVDAVKRLCDRAIYLSHGKVVTIGRAKQVCDFYEESQSKILSATEINDLTDFSKPDGEQPRASEKEREYGDKDATINVVQFQDKAGETVTALKEEAPFSVVYSVEFHADCDGVEFGMMLKTVDGVPVYGINTIQSDTQKQFKRSQTASVVFNLQGNLVPGVYYLNVGVTHAAESETRYLHRRVDCRIIRILSSRSESSIGNANLFASKFVEVLPVVVDNVGGNVQ